MRNSILVTSLLSWSLDDSISYPTSLHISRILCCRDGFSTWSWHQGWRVGDLREVKDLGAWAQDHFTQAKPFWLNVHSRSQNEFLPIFKARIFPPLSSPHFYIENMLLAFKQKNKNRKKAFCFWNTCLSFMETQVPLTGPKESAARTLKQTRSWWAGCPPRPAVPRHLASPVRCSGNAFP